MAITYDQTAFQRLYGSPSDTYSRAFWQGFKPSADASPRYWLDLWQQRIVPAIGTVTGAQRVLYVGCGLGIGVEVTLDSGFAGTSVWGIDNSAYIQSLWPNTAQTRADVRAKLGPYDIRTVTATQLRILTGINNVRFTIIVTEDMISSYTQAELANASASVSPFVACQNWLAAGGKIIHLMMTRDGSTPDMTRWPANAQRQASAAEIAATLPPGEAAHPDGGTLPETWAGTAMTNPGSPPMTMAQWQALRPAPHQFVSMEGL